MEMTKSSFSSKDSMENIDKVKLTDEMYSKIEEILEKYCKEGGASMGFEVFENLESFKNFISTSNNINFNKLDYTYDMHIEQRLFLACDRAEGTTSMSIGVGGKIDEFTRRFEVHGEAIGEKGQSVAVMYTMECSSEFPPRSKITIAVFNSKFEKVSKGIFLQDISEDE